MAKIIREAYENLILELYPESRLPLCWQVVYQEGMRNNHFLFAKEDTDRFLRRDQHHVNRLVRDCGDDLITAFVDIICLGIHSDIKNKLDSLPKAIQEGVFHLYLRLLRNWTFSQRAELN